MRITSYLFLLFATANLNLSCISEKKANNKEVFDKPFNKIEWMTQDNGAYPQREYMLQYLIDSVPLKAMRYEEVLSLLGPPDRVNDGHLYYKISQKSLGVFPLSTKTFVIKLGADSIVEWRKIHGG